METACSTFSRTKIARNFDLRMARFLVGLLRTMLSHQYVRYGDQIYIATSGLSTGLSVCSTLANVYLSIFDGYIRQSLRPIVYVRYIDDGFMIVDEDVQDAAVTDVVSSWYPGIGTKEATSGTKEIVYLDLKCSFGPQGAIFETNRKALATYDYIPVTSAHSASSSHSLVSGECRRLLLTNSTASCFEKHLLLFKKKLVLRGYDLQRFERTFSRMTFGAKHCLLKGKRGKTDAPIVRLKLKHVRGLSKPFLRQCVSRHAYILRPLRSKACIDFSSSVGSSLFRILHRTTW